MDTRPSSPILRTGLGTRLYSHLFTHSKQLISCGEVFPWVTLPLKMKYQCVYVALVSLLVAASQQSTTVDGCLSSTTYPTKVLSGGSGECQSEQIRSEIKETVGSLLRSDVLRECKITNNTSNFSCGGTAGWTQVVYVDITNSSHQCPSSFREYTSPARACGRQNTTTGSCDSATYGVNAMEYSQVCGRIIAYQIGTPAAFFSALRRNVSIDSWYLEGISLTHGSPRQHIWSFAATPSETYHVTPSDPSLCPCSNTAVTYSTPSFVGNDYFCETANSQPCCPKGMFFTNNLLWDGQGCGAASTCCSYNTPPWFYKRLPAATSDDIEVRICSDMGTNDDDTPFKVMEIYVK